MKHLSLIAMTMLAAVSMFSATTISAADAGTALNKKGFELFKILCNDDAKANVFISPFSINSAFGMVYAGAKGDTAKQLSEVMGLPAEEKESSDYFGKLLKRYKETEGKDNSVYISNSIWTAEDQPLLDSYKAVIDAKFGGAFFRENFKAPAPLVAKINSYVEDHTGKMIKNLLSADDISKDTKMILLNTLYFKAKWFHKFAKSNTIKDTFHLFGGTNQRVDMMYQQEEFAYFADAKSNVHGVVLPYQDVAYEMVLMMPQNAGSDQGEKALNEMIAQLPEKFQSWYDSAMSRKVQVWVPKTKTGYKKSLIPTLSKMGLALPFSDKADFSGIGGKKDLRIEFVIHQTALEMDEESTRAAAATAMGMARITSLGPVERTMMFRADRPFVCIIYDRNEQNVLFAGRITDPTK